MSIEYYSQDEAESPVWEENPDDRLVCPECGCDVTISDGGLIFLCLECLEEGIVSTLSCRKTTFTSDLRTKEEEE